MTVFADPFSTSPDKSETQHPTTKYVWCFLDLTNHIFTSQRDTGHYEVPAI